MLNLESLNLLLKSLNLQLEKVNGVIYVHDYNSDTFQTLTKKDDKYHYLFYKDEIVYHLTFDSTHLKLSNGLGEVITIGDNSFEYCKKDDKDISRNESLLVVNPGVLSFYQQKKLKATPEEHYAVSIKTRTARDIFLFYKKSETIGLNGTLKMDSIASYDDEDIAIIENHTRHYNNDGHLINSDSDEITLGDDLNEFVIEEFSSQNHTRELLARVNTIIPGIGDALIKINPNLLPIIQRITDKTKKKQ